MERREGQTLLSDASELEGERGRFMNVQPSRARAKLDMTACTCASGEVSQSST